MIPEKAGTATAISAKRMRGDTARAWAGNRAVLVRQENGQQTRQTVRLRDLLDGGDISANVAMRPGDVLIIPESRF